MFAQRSLPLALVVAALGGCGHAGNVPPAGPRPADAANAAPPARPSTAEKPEPPATPAEIRFALCALQAGSPHGLQSLEAVRRADQPDTFAILSDRRVPLAEAVGEAMVAGETGWFRARRNLEVSLGPGRLPRRFAIYDVGRVIERGQLTFLGNVDGLPVFAAATDMTPVRDELAKRLESELDLPRNLAASAPLRASFRALEVVYVPLRPSGCVFQALVRVVNPVPRAPAPATPDPAVRPVR